MGTPPHKTLQNRGFGDADCLVLLVVKCCWQKFGRRNFVIGTRTTIEMFTWFSLHKIVDTYSVRLCAFLDKYFATKASRRVLTLETETLSPGGERHRLKPHVLSPLPGLKALVLQIAYTPQAQVGITYVFERNKQGDGCSFGATSAASVSSSSFSLALLPCC